MQQHFVVQQEPYVKEHILYDPIYMKSKYRQASSIMIDSYGTGNDWEKA